MHVSFTITGNYRVLQGAFLKPSIQEIPITPDNYSLTINIGNSYINSLIKSHLGSNKWLVNLDFSCSRMCYVIHDIHSVRSSSVHVNNYILVKTFSEKALINFSHHYWMPLQCTLVKHGSRPPQFTRVMKEPSCARMCIEQYHIWIVVPSCLFL